jgi:hypothetical protein
MGELTKSSFQMLKFSIQSIHYDATTWDVKGTDYNSTITAVSDISFHQETKNWMAMIHLEYELVPKQELEQDQLPSMMFKISAISVFSMDGNNDEETQQLLEQMLKLNGMISTIGALRSLLIVLSMQLGITPPIIFPNIDLRNIGWAANKPD